MPKRGSRKLRKIMKGGYGYTLFIEDVPVTEDPETAPRVFAPKMSTTTFGFNGAPLFKNTTENSCSIDHKTEYYKLASSSHELVNYYNAATHDQKKILLSACDKYPYTYMGKVHPEVVPKKSSDKTWEEYVRDHGGKKRRKTNKRRKSSKK